MKKKKKEEEGERERRRRRKKTENHERFRRDERIRDISADAPGASGVGQRWLLRGCWP